MVRNAVLFATLGWACAAAADEPDPIKEKLFKAKTAYDAEMAQFRKAAGEWFDKRAEAARGAGDKKALDQVKAERKTFDENGELPKTAPAAVQQKSGAAKKALETAYTQAVKEYTKAKKDDEAAAVEKESENFRKGDAEKLHRAALLGTWKVTVGGYKGEWTFKEDGVVDSSTNGAAAGKWAIDTAKKQVLITWQGGLQDKFDLPLNPKGTTGSQVGRMNTKLEAVKSK
jgi:hypothetical protein